MGKDWLHWIVGGGGGGRSSARRRRRTSVEMEEAAATSAGCMCAVFHLFDLHHFHQFPLNHQTSAAGFRPTININPSLHEEATTSKDCATPLRGGAVTEYRDYIQIILQRAGIINNPLNLPKWCTPLHPIDPSIFHHVELCHPTTTVTVTGGNSILSHRCNRKLIFQLVNELLGEIVRPRFVIRPSISQICDDSQFGLVDELCKRIDDFPAANCLVLEDIDSLIDRDLRQPQLNGPFEEKEKESIVSEIEGEIMELLVRETVVVMGWR